MTDGAANNRVLRAEAHCLPSIVSLLEEVTRWLAALGTDQWQDNSGQRRTRITADIGEGTVFVVERGHDVIATITVDEFADSDFWRARDETRNALFVHRMAVRRDHAGIGLGTAMLDWAAARAERCGRSLLHLDGWANNEKLHLYYKELGFEMIRNVPLCWRGSGALFARAASYRHGDGPALVDDVARLTPLPSPGGPPAAEPAPDRRHPRGGHRVGVAGRPHP
ncbi:MAG: GNAT family N-acetyltransferase [Pseudonocardia sp.]